jgi:hypothetical protein
MAARLLAVTSELDAGLTALRDGHHTGLRVSARSGQAPPSRYEAQPVTCWRPPPARAPERAGLYPGKAVRQNTPHGIIRIDFTG